MKNLIKPVMCDFCLSALSTRCWTYPTGEHIIEMPGSLPDYHDDGFWAACDTCKPLVDARDVITLLERSIRAEGVEISAEKLQWKTELFNDFFANKGEGFIPTFVRDGQHR